MLPFKVIVAVALLLGTAALPRPAQAASFKTRHSFTGGTDGAGPYTAPIFLNGMLYGATSAGGTGCEACGTIYKLDPETGAESTLYSFQGGADGAGPVALIAVDGVLYGTTSGGGNKRCRGDGCGTVFKLDPATGAETILHVFRGHEDGAQPNALMFRNGLLYGTTATGGGKFGTLPCCSTLFSIDPATGTETILHEFRGAHGSEPAAAFFAGNSLYGTDDGGGQFKDGAIFRLDMKSGKFSNRYSFTGNADGLEPYGLTRNGDIFYGATSDDSFGCCGGGTIFSFDSKSRIETVLYNFPYDYAIQQASGPLTYAEGKIYGTMATGGSEVPPGCDGDNEGCGEVFSIDPNTGAKSIVWAIENRNVGLYMYGGVTYHHGKLYGTTVSGGGTGCGGSGCGTVFMVKP
jgi:uncharacterized repeat protein (TIGR03803 family)